MYWKERNVFVRGRKAEEGSKRHGTMVRLAAEDGRMYRAIGTEA